MKAIGPVRLYASATEASYTLPSNTMRIILTNQSMSQIRYAFVTGKVDTASIANNPIFQEFQILQPGETRSISCKMSGGGTFYYACSDSSAEFDINALVP